MTITSQTSFDSIRTGDDYSIDLQITDSDDNAVDITGFSFTFEIRDTKFSSSPIVTASTSGGEITITDAANGDINISLSDTVTDAFPTGVFHAALDSIDGGSIKNTEDEGYLQIRPRIAQAA